MRTMSAKEAKDGFGSLIDAAQRGPVIITRQGREVAVVLSKEDFARLEAMEDAHWGRLAMAAMEEGSIGLDESDKLLREMLDAED